MSIGTDSCLPLYSCDGGIKSTTTRQIASNSIRGSVKCFLNRARLAFARQYVRAVLRYTFGFVGGALIRFKGNGRRGYVNVDVNPTP